MNIVKIMNRHKNKRKTVQIIALLICIAVGVAGIYLMNQHFEKAQEAKAKAVQIEKKKKAAAALNKAEKEKQEKIQKNLDSIKPAEVTGEITTGVDVPLATLAAATNDSLNKAFEGTLIIGDSRTEGLKFFSGITTAEFFSTKSLTVNRIVEGKKVIVDGVESSISDVLGKATYGKVIVCVGLNEVGWGNVDRFLESYGQLVDQIRAAQPNARIYLQSILPVSAKKSASQTAFTNPNIMVYNEGIVKLAASENVDFINPSAPLIDGTGALLSAASTDGIHLNVDYCKLWAQSIADIISPEVLVKQMTENQELPAESNAN
ncbi:MAG: GDSL-type esterase/lipase family protein [Eubacteriales bacterium]